MDDKKSQEATKGVVDEKSEALVLQEVSFEEQLSNAVEQNKDQFYQNILKQADTRIKAQDVQIREIQKQQVEFRDEIALRCFIPLISLISGADNYRQAASSAYRAADDFLRVREGGEIK